MSADKSFTSLFYGVLKSEYLEINLSKTNADLASMDLSNPNNLSNYISKILENNNSQIGYGGYLEHRNLYNHSTIFTKDSNPRNIHLGVDFWIAEDSLIRTPFDGVVHSYKNNNQPGDYGPTLILSHYLNGESFYSLYGHLSVCSLEGLSKGKVFKKGQALGKIGNPVVNGGYAPHLHFQIIKDLDGYHGDYPGVASAHEINYFKNNCPNPLTYIGLE